MLQGKVLVGHSIHNDLEAMEYTTHDPKLIRDISLYPGYRYEGKPTRLKSLAWDFLNFGIQNGTHSPAEDARAAMGLYILHKHQIDSELKFGGSRV